MGRPVWTASNHFTTISPGGRAGDKMAGEQGPGREASGVHEREVSATRGQPCLVWSVLGPGARGLEWRGGSKKEPKEIRAGKEAWGQNPEDAIATLVPLGLGELLRVSEEGALMLRCCSVSVGARRGSGARGDGTKMFGESRK